MTTATTTTASQKSPGREPARTLRIGSGRSGQRRRAAGDGRRATAKKRVIPSRQARDRDRPGRETCPSFGTTAIPRCAAAALGMTSARCANSSSQQQAAVARSRRLPASSRQLNTNPVVSPQPDRVSDRSPLVLRGAEHYYCVLPHFGRPELGAFREPVRMTPKTPTITAAVLSMAALGACSTPRQSVPSSKPQPRRHEGRLGSHRERQTRQDPLRGHRGGHQLHVGNDSPSLAGDRDGEDGAERMERTLPF